MLIANINTVYSAAISGGIVTSEFLAAWSVDENCIGTVTGKTSEFINAWSVDENCNGTVSGVTSEFINAWSTTEQCI